MDLSGWLMIGGNHPSTLKVAWSTATMGNGAQCVIPTGIVEMPLWSAGNLDSTQLVGIFILGIETIQA